MAALDSGFHDVNLGSQVLDLRFHLNGFWIPGCGVRFQGTGFKIPPHWIPDSMLWILDPRYWIQDSTSMDSGFQDVESASKVLDSRFHLIGFQISCCGSLIPGTGFQIPLMGFRIPKSWIPNSTSKYFLYSGLHEQIFLGFRNSDYPTLGIMKVDVHTVRRSSRYILFLLRTGTHNLKNTHLPLMQGWQKCIEIPEWRHKTWNKEDIIPD